MLKCSLEKLFFYFSTNNSNAKQSEYNEDTVKTILEMAKSEYANEIERNKHVEDKAKFFITFSGILITICLAIIGAIKENDFFALPFFSLIIIVGFSFNSMRIFSKILTIRTFHILPLNKLITCSEMKKDNSTVMAALAVSYEEAVNKNNKVIDEKIQIFNKGINSVQFVILLLIVIVVSIICSETDFVKKIIK